MPATVGVLGLQGGVREHRELLERAGARVVLVRATSDLAGPDGFRVDALVLPGGESSTIDKLLRMFGLFEPLREAIGSGVPTLATCAGLVLAARQIIDPAPGQQSLGVLDVAVRRNALGPQVASMETELATARGRVRAAFIRAPVVTAVGSGVEVIARIGTQVVGVSTPTITGVAFHPELTGDATFHRHLVRAASGEAGAGEREAVLSG